MRFGSSLSIHMLTLSEVSRGQNLGGRRKEGCTYGCEGEGRRVNMRRRGIVGRGL